MSKKTSVLEKYPQYEAVIGFEVHVQLSTKSKIFAPAIPGSNETPNINIDEVTCGHPGTLPVLNKEVVNRALQMCLATNAHIHQQCEFARKHYTYPDLPKGYQITQSDTPIGYNGYIVINDTNGNKKNIRINRLHMEEDAGKNTHGHDGNSYVNYNRAGTPLLEIVTEPDISSSDEARQYLHSIHNLVLCLGVGTGQMEDGAMRADTNISVRKKGDPKLGTKCELKNINSFKFISDAIDYEIERQITALEAGETIEQETRLWDTKNRKTIIMRGKENAADYCYFIDPDLPKVDISDEWLKSIKNNMPELPNAKKERFMKDYGLSEYESSVLCDDLECATYFEQAYRRTPSNKLINWMLREVMGYCKIAKIGCLSLKFTPGHLANLLALIDKNTITNQIAKSVFENCIQSGMMPADYVNEHDLAIKMMDESQLYQYAQDIIDNNPTQVKAYKEGKDRLFGFFVGKMMAATKGSARPDEINRILKELINKA